MQRDAAFVEYVLVGLLDHLNSVKKEPFVSIGREELKQVLGVSERLRPERIGQLRDLCAKNDIGYAVIGDRHDFYYATSRTVSAADAKRLIALVEEVDDVYGSKRADELYDDIVASGLQADSLVRRKR